MSVEALRAAFRHSASTGAARLVLLAMADEASSDGELTAYRRSQSWIAGKANVDGRTVQRALDKLVELGELVVLAQGTGRTRSDYRLVLPGLGDGVEPPQPRGGTSPPLGVADDRGRGGESPPPSPPSPPLDSRSGVTSSDQLTLVGDPTPAALSTMTPGVVLGSDRDLAFVAFWDAFPRKVGKGAARQAWARARRRGVTADDIVRGAQRYAAERAGEDPQYTAHPASWLNAERWGDEPTPERRPVQQQGPPRSATGRTMAAFRNVVAGREDQPAGLPTAGTAGALGAGS